MKRRRPEILRIIKESKIPTRLSPVKRGWKKNSKDLKTSGVKNGSFSLEHYLNDNNNGQSIWISRFNAGRKLLASVKYRRARVIRDRGNEAHVIISAHAGRVNVRHGNKTQVVEPGGILALELKPGLQPTAVIPCYRIWKDKDACDFDYLLTDKKHNNTGPMDNRDMRFRVEDPESI